MHSARAPWRNWLRRTASRSATRQSVTVGVVRGLCGWGILTSAKHVLRSVSHVEEAILVTVLGIDLSHARCQAGHVVV